MEGFVALCNFVCFRAVEGRFRGRSTMEILDGPDMDRKKVFFVYLHNGLNHPTMNRLTIFLLLALSILFACTQKEQEVQEIRVESVTLSQSSAEIEIGKTLQLNATVSPSMATRKDITWSSSKSSVASVSSSGLVTAVSEGTTTITASADGKKGECTVTVVKKAIVVSELFFCGTLNVRERPANHAQTAGTTVSFEC